MITEEQIWNYLDGTLNKSERAGIEQALSADSAAAKLYNEISAFNRLLKTSDGVKPSASFTAQVMDAVPIKYAYIKPAAVPITTLLLFIMPALIITVGLAAWLIQNANPSFNIPLSMPSINFTHYSTLFIAIDIALVVYLIDELPEVKRGLFSMR